MKVLELFCGLGGWSKPFIEAGHDVTGIDILNLGYPGKFIQADLFDYMPEGYFDIILASPPCTEFSIAKKWGWGTQDERQGLDLVYRTFEIIEKLKPKWYLIENVKGLAEFLPPPNDIVRYGKKKSTKSAYLWTNIPKFGLLPPMISYVKHDNPKCSKSMRGLIPKELAKAVLDSIGQKGDNVQ